MHLQTFVTVVLLTLSSICFVQGQVTLWSKVKEFRENRIFNWNFPFKLFQLLPNPDYHGLETRNSNEKPFQPQKDCTHNFGNLTSGSSGTITSPNYPKNYPPSLRCEWAFESEPGTVIRVTFFDVVTQPWFLFFYDYLAVSLDGNWDKFYRMTGDMNRIAPISLESSDNKLGVRFTSGFDIFNYRGFKMAYVVTRRSVSDETSPNSNSTTGSVDYGNGTDISAICDYVPVTLPPESTGDIPERVVGGSEMVPHEYPFVVAMLIDETNFCSGSLIDEFHVLTAAHCTNGSKKIELFFGVHDMREEEKETRQYQLINPVNVVQHPYYDPATSAHDIAIVKLNRRVKTTAFVQPVYLPSVYSMGNSFRGWKLTVMGWGDTNQTNTENDGKINPVLRKVTSSVVSNERCRETYRNMITGNMLCTEDSKSDSCYGDSGSPLVAKFSRTQNVGDDAPVVVNDDNQSNQCYFTKSHRDRVHQEKARPGNLRITEWFVQLGLLSFGSRNCKNENPVAYTRVTAYLKFISSVVSQESKID